MNEAKRKKRWHAKQQKLIALHRKQLISRIRERYGKHNH